MELLEKDLMSIQEVRLLLKKAKEAHKILATFNQEKIDRIVKAIAEASLQNAERLAKMANEETGFGIWQDKVVKNVLVLWGFMRQLRIKKQLEFFGRIKRIKQWRLEYR